MFTGLIQDLGTVRRRIDTGGGVRLVIESDLAGALAAGDSVAVDGVCLTATDVDSSSFTVEVMNQTLGLTTVGSVSDGSRVNLEPAARIGDRIGGHLVQGHVDGKGRVVEVREDGFARRLKVQLPTGLERYTVLHGSVCINGVSLTIADVGDDWIEVSLIPETLERTDLSLLEHGDELNVECDQIARYLERLSGGMDEGRTSDARRGPIREDGSSDVR